MRVIEYEEKYLLSLEYMVADYFRETHGENVKGDMTAITRFVRHSIDIKSVYLLFTKEQPAPIGFMVVFLNDEQGMVDTHVVCEYQYIKPSFRNGISIAYFVYTLAKICTKLEVGIVNTTYNTSSSTHNMKKLGGTVLSTTSYLTAVEAQSIYYKYKRRIKE